MSRVSPCVVWAKETDLPETCADVAVTPETLSAAFVFASDVLYNLTKRRWPGLCSDTFRPSGDRGCWFWRCRHGSWADYQGSWASQGWSSQGSTDTGSWAFPMYWHDSIKLPAIDVRAITKVTINGVDVDPSKYMLRKNRLVAHRQPDGSVISWPCYNDPLAAAGAVDTWTIEYTHGGEPPPSMVTACALLAWEFAVAWTPDCDSTCRLPKRVTTVTRAGNTFAIIDPLNVFDKGMVGIPDIDVLIQSVNRGEATQRAFVGRPGAPSRSARR